ncbi:MAG: hypothetical protein ACRDPW_01060, partial [Mycobacteriales bacterium]
AALRLGLHTVVPSGQLLVADTMAGNDNVTGGLPSIADGAFIMVNPTRPSIDSYRQIADTYTQLGVPNIAVIANAVEDDGDLTFIADRVGHRIDCVFPREKLYFRARDEGEHPELPAAFAYAVGELHGVLANWKPEAPRDKYLRAVTFHNKNNPNQPIPDVIAREHAASYANRAVAVAPAAPPLARLAASATTAGKNWPGPRSTLGVRHAQGIPVAGTDRMGSNGAPVPRV